MDAHKLQLKIYLTPESARAVDVEDLIPVFHRWIKQRLLPELTIDVANYRHVPQGPGVVLIGHGSDYFLDEGEGRPGLLHNRKRAGLAPGERLGDLARRTLHAASLLERDPALAGKVKLRDQRAAVPRQRPARRPQQRRDVGRAAARAGGAVQDAVRRPLRAGARGRRRRSCSRCASPAEPRAAGDAARARGRAARRGRVAGSLTWEET